MTSNATEEPPPPPPMPTAEAAAERASCAAAVGHHIGAACTGVMRSSRRGSGYSSRAAGQQRNVRQATASLLTPEPTATCSADRRSLLVSLMAALHTVAMERSQDVSKQWPAQA